VVPEEPQFAHLNGYVRLLTAVYLFRHKCQASGPFANEVCRPIAHSLNLAYYHFSYRLSQVTESISKKPLPLHVKYLTLVVTAEDEEGKDVDVSSVLVSQTEANSKHCICRYQT
jgi:hypothetical protein